MLNKETSDSLRKSIKEINKEKDIDLRIELMIKLKDDARNQFNEYLDDLFAEVNLIPKKSFVDEDEYLN